MEDTHSVIEDQRYFSLLLGVQKRCSAAKGRSVRKSLSKRFVTREKRRGKFCFLENLHHFLVGKSFPQGSWQYFVW